MKSNDTQARRMLADVLNKGHVLADFFLAGEASPDAREAREVALRSFFNDLEDVRAQGRAAGLFAQERGGRFLCAESEEEAIAAD